MLILEAKRTTYSKACKPRTQRGVKDSGFNSSLNGQLELDYALALAMEQFSLDGSELVEPEWILRTPFAVERQGYCRRLKNPIVLREVVGHFAGLPLQNYFFAALTTDKANPFVEVANAQILPELYHPDFGFKDCWPEMRNRFGWLSYEKLESVLKNLQARELLQGDSLFSESLSMNRGNMEFPIQALEDVNAAQMRAPKVAADPGSQQSRGQEWVFKGKEKLSGDAVDFLARCDEEGRKVFEAFIEMQKQLNRITKITWDHESGFSMQFYFKRLGWMPMVWGFPSFNKGGAPSRNRQSFVFPFDFASKRGKGVPDDFLTKFGQALSEGCTLSGGRKRPSISLSHLSTTEIDHVLRTTASFAEKASNLG